MTVCSTGKPHVFYVGAAQSAYNRIEFFLICTSCSTAYWQYVDPKQVVQWLKSL